MSRCKWIPVLLAACLVLFLTSCDQESDMGRLKHWVTAEKAKPGAPLKPLPELKKFKRFTYAGIGKRDPFSSGVRTSEKKKEGPHPDLNRPQEPLEAFSLDSLVMVGTINSGKNMVVLIQDPEHKIHRVHKGQYMGRHYGKVIDITPDHVSLREFILDGNKGWKKHKTRILLTVKQ